MAEEVHDVRLEVNGATHAVRVPARRLLSDALRHDLGLTGTHVGCEHGVCGACTVLLDGRSVRSCLMLAVQARGHEVTTVEGVAGPDGFHPVQQGFYDCHAFQCGFCTPGFVMTTVELLADDPTVDEPGIREALSGNVCRCTGYESIVEGVLRAKDLAAEQP